MRVTFVRGPRRDVDGVDSSWPQPGGGAVHAVRVEVDVSVLADVSDEDEDEVDDGALMSVVTGGLVVVIVAVVVGVDDPVAVAENDGST